MFTWAVRTVKNRDLLTVVLSKADNFDMLGVIVHKPERRPVRGDHAQSKLTRQVRKRKS